ncbi:MAG: site-specific integrase [Deltaproteobacteria bacterium]|nr:site-specific integrase [Deltaproteobacteria bacterium]
MTIQKHGSGWLLDIRVRTPDGRTSRLRRVVHGSRRKAEQWATEIANAAKLGRLVRPPSEDEEGPRPLPFTTFAWEWFDAYVVANNKPSEQVGKRIDLTRHLVPFFGNQEMREITAQDVERLKAEKLKTLSPKTVNNILACLKKLFNSAVEWGRLEFNPIARVKKLHEPEYEWDFLTRDESEAFLAELDSRWFPLFATLLWTGMRIGEALALRWDDIEWRSGKVLVRRSLFHKEFVTPKSGKPREIPMNSRLVEVLKAARHERGELVFCTLDGKVLDQANVKRPFFAALRKAGLRIIRVHDLRHSFASQLAIEGLPLKVIQELLGHQSMAMTLRYAHLVPES